MNFVGGGVSTNSVEDREKGDLVAVAPLIRVPEGSCNLVQEISYSTFFLIVVALRVFTMTTNLFVIANVKQMRK